MSYTVDKPRPFETDISCVGCGADLLVTTDWVFKEVDEEVQVPVYDMDFVSVSCSSNSLYGCICPLVEESMYVATLREQVIDHWYGEEERRMEMYH